MIGLDLWKYGAWRTVGVRVSLARPILPRSAVNQGEKLISRYSTVATRAIPRPKPVAAPQRTAHPPALRTAVPTPSCSATVAATRRRTGTGPALAARPARRPAPAAVPSP